DQAESASPRLAAVEPIQRAWDGEEGVLDQPTPVGDEAHRDVVDPLAAESQENVDTSDFPPHESAQPTELIEEAEPTQTTNEKLEEIVEASHINRLDDTNLDNANRAERSQHAKQYLYIEVDPSAPNAEALQSLIAVLRYVAATQPEIGSNVAEAAQADQVVVLGEYETTTLEALTAAGAQVEPVSGNLIELFERLLKR
ncbi:MAG: hypothetical protein KDE54_19780, partial [Caldilineaceae bacterium]|nr:hypothetical protein [Caldilineaceae bacterium]